MKNLKGGGNINTSKKLAMVLVIFTLFALIVGSASASLIDDEVFSDDISSDAIGISEDASQINYNSVINDDTSENQKDDASGNAAAADEAVDDSIAENGKNALSSSNEDKDILGGDMGISVVGGKNDSYNVGDTVYLKMGTEQGSYTPSEIYIQVEGGGYKDNYAGTYTEATSATGVPYKFTTSGSINLRLIQNYYGTYYFSDYVNFNVIGSSSDNGSGGETEEDVTARMVIFEEDDPANTTKLYYDSESITLYMYNGLEMDGYSANDLKNALQYAYVRADVYIDGSKVTDTYVGYRDSTTNTTLSSYTKYNAELSQGVHTIQYYYPGASYSGITVPALWSNKITVYVGVQPPIETSLSLTLNPGSGNTTGTGSTSLTVNEEDMVTFIGKLSPSVTNPKLVLYQNGTKIQNRTFYNGWFTLSMNTPGEYEYYLVYEGNSTHEASTSEKVTVTVLSTHVEPKDTSITLEVDDYNPKTGDYLIVTPTVSSEGSAVTEGTVEIYVGDTLVNSTTAGSTCNYYDLSAPGTIKMHAVYKGTDNYKTSTSEEIEIVVKDSRIASDLTLTANASEVAIGDSITIFNNLTNASELDYFTSFSSQFERTYNYSISDYIPVENITIFLNGEKLGTATVNPNGLYKTNFTFSGFDAPGWYNFTASYDGNDKVQGSTTNVALSFYIEEKAPIKQGTYTDLESLINKTEAGGVLDLEYDFAYDAEYDGDSYTNAPGGVLVSKDITINGHGHSISGEGLKQILDVWKANVTLIDVVLENGNAQYGGAIIVSNSITKLNLINSTIKDCKGSQGGAIHVMSGSVNIEGTEFANNTAGTGGAIYYNTGANPLVIKDSKFIENKATGTGTVSGGGAIHMNAGGSKLVVSGTEFTKNTAATDGGAIYSISSGVNMDISSSNFTENSAGNGGAIYGTYSNMVIKVDDVNFTRNSAGTGGAIYNNKAELTVENSNFVENEAAKGAALWTNAKTTVESSSFSAAEGSDIGNQVYATSNDAATIRNTVFEAKAPEISAEESYFTGDDIVIKVAGDFPRDFNKMTMTYTLNGEEKTLESVESNFTVDLGNELAADSYTFEVKSFTDDSGNVYNVKDAKASFEVIQKVAAETQTALDLSAMNAEIGKNITVTPSVTANGAAVESGKVEIYANGEKIATIDLGTSYEFAPAIAGEYNISASFVETEDYKASSSANKTVTFTKKASRTESSGNVENVQVGDEVAFTVNVYGNDGAAISSGKIAVYENSVKIGTIDVGQAYTYVPQSEGFKTVYFLFEGNDEYGQSSDEGFFFQVSPKPVDTVTSIEVNVSEITIGDKILIKPTVTAKGEAVSGFVNLYINGSAISVIIGEDFEIALQNIGECEIYAVFEDNGQYKASESERHTVIVKDLPKETKSADDLQALIDNAEEGAVIELGDFAYENISNVKITKNVTIKGSENTTVSSSGDGNPIFVVPGKSDNGPEGFTIQDINFLVKNGDTIVKVIADNGTDANTIDNPEINIINNNFTKADDSVVGKSVTVLELDSERTSLAPMNAINIDGNNVDEGMKTFQFEMTSLSNGTGFNIPVVSNATNGTNGTAANGTDANGTAANGTGSNGTSANAKIPTAINSKKLIKTTAIDVKADGKKGAWYQLTLKDKNGKVLSNKTVKLIFANGVYNLKTNAKGIAKFQLNVKKAGTYTAFATFLGDDAYGSSFVSAKVKVLKQKVKVKVSKKTYRLRAKSKILKVTLKTSRGKAIKGKKVSFKVRGKTYTAKTNKKGLAKIKIKLRRRGTFKGRLTVPTDATYKKLTKKIKIKIK